MKQLLLTLSTTVLAFFVGAAQDQGKVYFGARAGAQVTLSRFTTNTTLPTSLVPGGSAGLFARIPFDNRLYFLPQADVSYRGMTTDSLQPNQFSNIREWHLRLMPLLEYEFKKPGTTGGSWFLQFGPSLGFGFWGIQSKQDANGQVQKSKLKYGFQAYGRYDAHWHTGLGYQTAGGWRLYADYAYGLGNMINTDGGPTLRYSTISLNLACLFRYRNNR